MELSNSLALVLILGLIGCSYSTPSLRESAMSINPGQTKEDIQTILGVPRDRQFQGNQEAWQYCNDFVVAGVKQQAIELMNIWFNNGLVTGLQNLPVARNPVKSCEEQLHKISWEDAPDTIIEIRKH